LFETLNVEETEFVPVIGEPLRIPVKVAGAVLVEFTPYSRLPIRKLVLLVTVRLMLEEIEVIC
jgi:hypothetical protein